MDTQYWLVTLDRYGNVLELVDGSHDDISGAHKAKYLYDSMGFTKIDKKYAAAKIELFEPDPESQKDNVNHEAINELNPLLDAYRERNNI